ncbi:MAG: methyltransferase [Bacteroidetes bacterium]|nr:methyltransferase [Bacteroidota bacterium]
MGQNIFHFKQFSVMQDKCAMKVNTDGVLLGAWASGRGAARILDIGTGTGVIALMMAQQNTGAKITAIDIDENAYLQAKENFAASLWNKNLDAQHIEFQKFSSENKFDIIISNPPYFIQDYKIEDEARNIARHSTALSYNELLEGINRLLSNQGKAFLIIPIFNLPLLQTKAEGLELYLTKLTEVTAVEGKLPYVVLIQLERERREVVKSQLLIQKANAEFTEEYKELTKEYYLKF